MKLNLKCLGYQKSRGNVITKSRLKCRDFLIQYKTDATNAGYTHSFDITQVNPKHAPLMIPWAFEMYFAFQTLVLYHSCFRMSITVLCVDTGKKSLRLSAKGFPFTK